MSDLINSHHRPRWILLALSLMFLVAYLLHPEAEHWMRPFALITLLVAFIVFLVGSGGNHILPTTHAPSLSTLSTNWLFVVLAIISVVILVEINTNILKTTVFQDLHQHKQALFLIGCVFCLLIGFAGWRSLVSVPNIEIIIPVGLTLLAFAIRIWHLQTAVSVPLADEYAFLDTAIAFWDKPDYPMLEPFDRGYAFPWTHPYLIVLSMEFFGWDVLQARLPSAVFGALTIPALYLLTRALFDRPTAIISALILATFPPHIHLSRMMLNNIYAPCFGTWALALIAHGYKTGRSVHFVVAGIMLGFTQYFYEAGRLLFPPVAFALIIIMLLQRNVSEWRQWLSALGRVVVIFALLALPIYLTLHFLEYPMFGRLELVAPAAGNLEFVLENTVDKNILSETYTERLGGVLLHFVQRLDNSPEFYGGTQAMVLTVFVPLFLTGVFVMLRYFQHPGHQLLIFWLGGAVAGIALVRIGAWTARFTPIFPAIALVMALGLVYIARVIVEKRYRWLVCAGVVSVVCIGQLYYYFGEHLDRYNKQVRTTIDDTDAIHRATEFVGSTTVYFIDDAGIFEPYLIILMRLWNRYNLDIVHYFYEEVTPNELLDMRETEYPIVFFIDPTLDETLTTIQQFFVLDGPYFSPHTDVPQHRQYALYYAVNR